MGDGSAGCGPGNWTGREGRGLAPWGSGGMAAAGPLSLTATAASLALPDSFGFFPFTAGVSQSWGRSKRRSGGIPTDPGSNRGRRDVSVRGSMPLPHRTSTCSLGLRRPPGSFGHSRDDSLAISGISGTQQPGGSRYVFSTAWAEP